MLLRQPDDRWGGRDVVSAGGMVAQEDAVVALGEKLAVRTMQVFNEVVVNFMACLS